MADNIIRGLFRGKELSTVGVLLIFIGFFYSFAAMSIGMFLLAGIGLWRLLLDDQRHFRENIGSRIAAFIKDPQWSAPVLVLVAVFISGLWSSDTEDWLWFSRLKLPFLVLPFSFYFLPSWSKKEFRILEAFFLILTWISTLPVLYHISVNYEEVAMALKKGHPVPTPTNHIRYSMLVAFAAVMSLFRSFNVPNGLFRWSYRALFLSLAITIFILSTRTGILVLTGSLVYLLFWYIWRGGNYKLAILLLAGFVLSGIVAVKMVPTLKQKVSYMRYDWERMRAGEGISYSDSERWKSLVAGWELWKSAPLTGVGMGDIERRSADLYREKWGQEKYKYPHNQLLFVLATTGIIGFILFLAGLLLPFSRAFLFKCPEIMILYINVFLASMVEHTLETATGITFFCLFLVFYTKLYQARLSFSGTETA